MAWSERWRALRLDLTPLRESRDFRLLFWAGTVFYLGAMVTYVAIPFQVYRLTGSNFAVGAIGLVELLPLIVFGLYGGALADHVDRRRLLIWTGIGQASFTAVLAVNAFSGHPSVVAIFVVSALLVSTSALQRPSREALMPRTVTHEQIPAANALTSLGMQLGVLVGPAVGGLLVAYVGIGWCFVIDILGLGVASLLYVLMRPYPHRGETTAPSFAGIGEGLRYAMGRRDLLGTYLVDVAAMLLAIPVVLFPALAEDVFERPQLLGLLYIAETVGALVATGLSGWTGRVHHVEPDHPGVDARSSGRDRDALLLPRPARRSGARRSDRRPVNVRGAISSGGAACVAGVGLTALWLRDFWAYDARTDEYATAERAARAATGDR